MIRHVVGLTWTADATEADATALRAALADLPGQIPEIRGYTFGTDLGLADGNADFAIVADFDDVDAADVDEAFAAWRAECDHARHVSAAHTLDDTGVRRGQPVSLRWILVHMIEEYSRHNGHADLLRQTIDGAVGD